MLTMSWYIFHCTRIIFHSFLNICSGTAALQEESWQWRIDLSKEKTQIKKESSVWFLIKLWAVAAEDFFFFFNKCGTGCIRQSGCSHIWAPVKDTNGSWVAVYSLPCFPHSNKHLDGVLVAEGFSDKILLRFPSGHVVHSLISGGIQGSSWSGINGNHFSKKETYLLPFSPSGNHAVLRAFCLCVFFPPGFSQACCSLVDHCCCSLYCIFAPVVLLRDILQLSLQHLLNADAFFIMFICILCCSQSWCIK